MAFKVHISKDFMISTCVVCPRVIIIPIDRHVTRVLSGLPNIVNEVEADPIVKVVRKTTIEEEKDTEITVVLDLIAMDPLVIVTIVDLAIVVVNHLPAPHPRTQTALPLLFLL